MAVNAAASRVLDGLDQQQVAAVVAPPGPVRIMAGAGTGKTRTVTHRIAYQHLTGAMPANQLLAVTHSRKAAGELRDRLGHLGARQAQAQTFHAAALLQLRHFWTHTGLPGNHPVIIGERDAYPFLRAALGSTLSMAPGKVDSAHVIDLRDELSWAAARQVSPTQYSQQARLAGRNPGLDLTLVAHAMDLYANAKRAAAVIDFADVLSFCAQTLEDVTAVADEVRQRYTAFVVDEYQDTDPAQQRLLDAWLGERDTLTAVGDARQAIYRFKGAESSLIRSFMTRYPNAVNVDLVKDYRSTPQVVTAANRLMAGTAEASGPELVGMLEAGPEPVVLRCADESGEDVAIAEQVRDWLRSGLPATEIAVLHRFRKQALSISEALRDAGILVSGEDGKPYFARREIVDVRTALRGAAARTPDAGGLVAFADAMTQAGFDQKNPPEGAGAAKDAWDALDSLRGLVHGLPSELTKDVVVLSRDLERRAEVEHVPTSQGAVTVSTIHGAKGLEWTAVIIARCVEGSLPSVFATTSEEKAEERRLAYVAMTRAKRILVATWAGTRPAGQRNARSPYLAVLEASAPRPVTRRPVARRTAPTEAGIGSGRTTGASGRPPVPAAAAEASAGRFTPGQRVNHATFGLGKVVGVDGSKVLADFGTYGKRAVLADGKLTTL